MVLIGKPHRIKIHINLDIAQIALGYLVDYVDFGEYGDSGDFGDSGEFGGSGKSGDSGESGYSGESGDSGESGYCGESGDSGDSGDSGEYGDYGESGDSDDSGLYSVKHQKVEKWSYYASCGWILWVGWVCVGDGGVGSGSLDSGCHQLSENICFV